MRIWQFKRTHKETKEVVPLINPARGDDLWESQNEAYDYSLRNFPDWDPSPRDRPEIEED
ncbi:MAG: hypothetical protein AAFQ82_07085 [Myxococcota bacterium]